jgi:hypothetical protein
VVLSERGECATEKGQQRAGIDCAVPSVCGEKPSPFVQVQTPRRSPIETVRERRRSLPAKPESYRQL